jgi:predicted ABC-type exoprotein transport system permease subunit
MTMIILDTIVRFIPVALVLKDRLDSFKKNRKGRIKWIMDKQLLLILLVGLVFAIWEYIKYKRQKELDERLQKHLWKYFNEKH